MAAASRPAATLLTDDAVAALVAGNLRRQRRRAGLSTAEIAERLGCTYQAYRRYEAGARRPSLDVIVHIGRSLGFPIAQLLAGLDGGTEPAEIPADTLAVQDLAALARTLPRGQQDLLIEVARHLAQAVAASTRRAA